MKRFSSSYVYRQSNYVLLGCEQFGVVETDWFPIASVVENLLQRGMPTHPSKRLVNVLGDPIRLDFPRPVQKYFDRDCVWGHTIKGSKNAPIYLKQGGRL